MKVKEEINEQVIAAAVSMLQPYAPDLTPTSLIEALENHNSAVSNTPKVEKPMTRQEVSKLLGVSLVTINRYLNSDKLRRIKLSGRTVRIDPESIRKFIGQEV